MRVQKHCATQTWQPLSALRCLTSSLSCSLAFHACLRCLSGCPPPRWDLTTPAPSPPMLQSAGLSTSPGMLASLHAHIYTIAATCHSVLFAMHQKSVCGQANSSWPDATLLLLAREGAPLAHVPGAIRSGLSPACRLGGASCAVQRVIWL